MHAPRKKDDTVSEEKAKPRKDINILVLGETGVGKSTWINGIANYLQYDTMEDAIKGDFKVLIPSSFVHHDEDGTVKQIQIGTSSGDEILQAGQSATQGPKEYVFETATSTIHIIDTPGIGDVRGIQKDKENFDNILTFLLKYPKVHAVCILLKPNNSRLTISFRFCVLELLSHLHKSLEENIMFCFTNSRATFYRPGDTMPALKTLLAEHKIGITLDKSRYFCFDNEAFRFLACVKNEISFEEDDTEMFSRSWEKSMKTTEKLFQRVEDLPPHDTKNTLSMNEARSIILAMAKPMAEMMPIIDNNKKDVESVKKEIDLAKSDISEFEKNLKFKGADLVIKRLDYPITVCAHKDCKKTETVGKTKIANTLYPVICHHHCTINGLPTETINDERLATCQAFEFATCLAYEKFFGKPVKEFPGYSKTSAPTSDEWRDTAPGAEFVTYDKEKLMNSLSPAKREEFEKYAEEKYRDTCWNCEHSYKFHMHITYTTQVVEKEFLSEEVQNKIKGKKNDKAKKDALVDELTKNIKELEEEKELIMTSGTKFGSFLKNNSIITYNDSFKEYIDMLIQDEQQKHEKVRDSNKIKQMEIDRDAYEERKKLLDEAINESNEDSIQTEEIFKMRDEMINLKHNGKALKDALDGILSARQQHQPSQVVSSKGPGRQQQQSMLSLGKFKFWKK